MSTETIITPRDGSEASLLEAIHAALARTDDPFERRVVRVVLDCVPGLVRGLRREAATDIPITEQADLAISLVHTLADIIALELCGGPGRASRALLRVSLTGALTNARKA